MLEFVEGTLAPTLSSAVARHIRQCPACMQELESHSSRTRALQKLGRVSAPDQWPEISRSIRRAGWMYFVRRYGLPAGIFGASAALVIVGLTAYMREPQVRTSNPARSDSVSMAGPIQPVKQLFEAASSVEAPATPESGVGEVGDAEKIAAELDGIEADHYGNMVGQFLDEGATLVVTKSGV